MVSWAFDQNSSISDDELSEMLFGNESVDYPENNDDQRILWIPSYTIESGIGFSDNPLFGPFIQQEATYWENSLEGFFLIESKPEFFTYLYLYGEGKIFEELPEQKSSAIYLGQFEHAYTPNSTDQTFGIRLRYTNYDQGFDFSELGLPYSMSIQSKKSEIIPYFSNRFSENLTATIEISVGTEDFKTISDDNNEKGISFSLEGSNESFNWNVQTEYLEKEYDERPKRNWDASILVGTTLETEKVNLLFEIEKENYLGFFKSSKAAILWSKLNDDGGGYYDYEKLSLSLKKEFKISLYMVEISLVGSQINYNKRQIGTGELFERENLTKGLSINRLISENLETYFRWSREEDFSNSRDYEYSSNFWSIGVIWEI